MLGHQVVLYVPENKLIRNPLFHTNATYVCYSQKSENTQYRFVWSPGCVKDPHPAQLTLVVMDHGVGVPKVEQILVEVDPTVLALHVRLQENLLEELPRAGLNAALEETAVVPGDPAGTVLGAGNVHQPREILTVEASLLLEAALLVEERFC